MKKRGVLFFNRVLWVTLFLILLAFFVFLNTLSKPDPQRRDRVQHSVRTGFGALPEMGAASPGVWRHRFHDRGVMELTDLVSRWGPEGAVAVDAGGTLWIRLPLGGLFPENAATLSGEGRRLVESLKPLLVSFGPGGRVMVHLARSAARDGAAALRLSLLRALTLAEALGSDVTAWGFGDLVPESAYGLGRDARNDRVVLVFPGAASDSGGSLLFRDFIFRIFSEGAW